MVDSVQVPGRHTCEARLKLGPGERFLAGAGGAAFAPALPLRLRRLLAGRCDSGNINLLIHFVLFV